MGVFYSLHEAAVALDKFNKARLKVYLLATREFARNIAKVARADAKSYKVIDNAHRHNKNIKVMIVPSARYSESKGEIVASVKATGIVAKIEKGLHAGKFWNNRGGSVRYKGWAKKKTSGKPQSAVFFSKTGGWKTVHKRAGGQLFKRHEFVRVSPGQMSTLMANIDRANGKAAEENL